MLAHSPPDQPVIIISVNYRLGVFGNMFLKELIEEDPEWPTAGNYFYLDVLSALRWIKKNIEDYGGDPSNISLFGESAGGEVTIDIGAVKGSANLYRTAISESGGSGNYLNYHNMSNQLDLCNSVVQKLNCTGDDKQKVLTCLRNASVEDLLTAYGYQNVKPIIDNYFFPLYPPLAIKNGTYVKDVSLIMGNNDFEQATCFQYPNMNSTGAAALLSQFVEPKWIPIIMDNYHLNNCSSDPNANISRCCDMVRLILIDKLFDCNVHRLYNALYSKYGPQYENNKLFWYHINCYPGVCPVIPEKQGGRLCRHTAELAYLFATTSGYNSMEPVNCTWDNASREFSNKIISYWINTATTGRPLAPWPNYDPSMPKYFYITPDQDGFLPVTSKRNCSIFDQIEEEGVIQAFGNNTYI
jgi:carboxylesterase type B